MNLPSNHLPIIPAWEKIRTAPGRTKTFEEFMKQLNESSVRKAKVKFGQEWGETK